jgi:hypothetical protein
MMTPIIKPISATTYFKNEGSTEISSRKYKSIPFNQFGL